jgi:hypothetical protein
MNDLDAWMAALEARHLADLTFAEVARSLRALSSTYVERRGTIVRGAALSGAGKRAAFALFYGPLHFILLQHIVRALPRAAAIAGSLVDLGCGTGAASAAWARECEPAPRIEAVDINRWAAAEARQTFQTFALDGRAHTADLARFELPRRRASFLAAFALNELSGESRSAMLERLLARAAGGDRVLIVEPLARGVAPWWNDAASRVQAAGGRADEWRFRAELPSIVTRLDRAAGLDHRELTARSLFL